MKKFLIRSIGSLMSKALDSDPKLAPHRATSPTVESASLARVWAILSATYAPPPCPKLAPPLGRQQECASRLRHFVIDFDQTVRYSSRRMVFNGGFPCIVPH